MTATWQAIDAWPTLQSGIHRKFRTSDEIAFLERREISPSDVGSKAACAIRTQDIDLTLRTNQGMNWPVAIRIDLYLPLTRYLEAHDLIEEVIKAAYQAHAEGITATYVELASCGPPQGVSSVSVKTVSFGKGEQRFKVWNASVVLLFAVKNNPFSNLI